MYYNIETVHLHLKESENSNDIYLIVLYTERIHLLGIVLNKSRDKLK